MNPGKQRLLELLVKDFIAELEAKDKCACRECLGWHLLVFLEAKVK